MPRIFYKRLSRLLSNIRQGFYYKIPLCCNLQWSFDDFLLGEAAINRVIKRNSYFRGLYANHSTELEYIPCGKCFNKFKAQISQEQIKKNLEMVEKQLRTGVDPEFRENTLKLFCIANE